MIFFDKVYFGINDRFNEKNFDTFKKIIVDVVTRLTFDDIHSDLELYRTHNPLGYSVAIIKRNDYDEILDERVLNYTDDGDFYDKEIRNRTRIKKQKRTNFLFKGGVHE